MLLELLIAGQLQIHEPKPEPVAKQETVQVIELIPEPQAPIVPLEPTLEEKIATNFYQCDETTHYIRADNATCLAKPIYTPTAEKPTRSPQQSPRASPRATIAGNTYTAGNCTWYVKSLRPDIPNNWGNASDWLANARAQGWPTGATPTVGAIGWTSGHVVVITSINGDGTVGITDMNGKFILYEIGHYTYLASKYTYIY